MKIKVTNIEWDIDTDDEVEVELPAEIVYSCDDNVSEKDIDDSIVDLISDDYGYCIKDLEYEIIK